MCSLQKTIGNFGNYHSKSDNRVAEHEEKVSNTMEMVSNFSYLKLNMNVDGRCKTAMITRAEISRMMFREYTKLHNGTKMKILLYA